MSMKLTNTRFDKLKKLIRAKLLASIKDNNNIKAEIYLKRLNFVLSVARARNISNGMPAQQWVNVTLDEVKAKAIEKGL